MDASRRDRTRALLDSEFVFDEICSHVANGGSVLDLCKSRDVRYSDVMAWIIADSERVKRYDAAKTARNEWADEALAARIRAMTHVDIRTLYKDGVLLPVNEWPDDAAAAVAGVDVFEEFAGSGKEREKIGETRKVKLFDVLKAAHLDGLLRGKFAQKHEVTGKLTLAELVAESQKEPAPAPAKEPPAA